MGGAAYVWNKAQFDGVDPAGTSYLLGLFERVTILKTNREMFGEHESIGFRLEATIGGAGGGAEGAGR